MSAPEQNVISLDEEDEDEDIPDVATCQVVLGPWGGFVGVVGAENVFLQCERYLEMGKNGYPQDSGWVIER